MRTALYLAIDIGLAVGLLSIYVARRHGMRAAGTIGSFLAHRGLIAGRGQPCCDRSRPLSRDGWCRRHWCLGACVQRMADGEDGGMDPADVRAVPGGRQHRNIRAVSGALFILSGMLFGSAFCAMAITGY
jgi:hypothetical protein